MTKRVFACGLLALAAARVYDFEVDGGAKADDDSAALANAAALNASLAALAPGDALRVPNKTFTIMGGVVATGLRDATLALEGTLRLSDDIDAWPIGDDGFPVDAIHLEDVANVTITGGAGEGTFDGNGPAWWGYVKYVELTNHRPILLRVKGATGLLLERARFVDAPRFNFYGDALDGVEIRHCAVDASRAADPAGHSAWDLAAFNTDGFDVSGRNVWIHDVRIWNQDDCIAVKKDAEDMLFERIEASGLGLSIGGVGHAHVVRNITFRDATMRETVKGIYIKVTSAGPTIRDVLYQNVTMHEPSGWPIWIGPAQQAISANPCHAAPCSLCWPDVPFTECNMPAATFANITLRDIYINKPQKSPGVILGNETLRMENIVFDNVVVTEPGDSPWGDDYYYCENVQDGVATGGTWPVPPCFEDRTSR